MANTKELFIVSILFILVISVALIVENEFSSYLQKLESNLESIKSMKSGFSRSYEEDMAKLRKMIHSHQHMLETIKTMDEKNDFYLRSYEEYIAMLKKMIAAYDEIIDSQQNKKIHHNHLMLESTKSMNEKSGFDMRRSDEEDNAKLKKVIVEKDEFIDSKQNKKIHPNHEWIPSLKIEFLTFISNLKPHLDFLTSKTSEAYHVSINTLTTIVEKLQRSETLFIEELYKSVMWLLSKLVKGINAFFQFCLEAAR